MESRNFLMYLLFAVLCAVLCIPYIKAEEDDSKLSIRKELTVEDGAQVTISEKILIPQTGKLTIGDDASIVFTKGGGITVEGDYRLGDDVTITAPEETGGTSGISFVRGSPIIANWTFKNIHVCDIEQPYSIFNKAIWMQGMLKDLPRRTSFIQGTYIYIRSCTFENVTCQNDLLRAEKLLHASHLKMREVSAPFLFSALVLRLEHSQITNSKCRFVAFGVELLQVFRLEAEFTFISNTALGYSESTSERNGNDPSDSVYCPFLTDRLFCQQVRIEVTSPGTTMPFAFVADNFSAVSGMQVCIAKDSKYYINNEHAVVKPFYWHFELLVKKFTVVIQHSSQVQMPDAYEELEDAPSYILDKYLCDMSIERIQKDD